MRALPAVLTTLTALTVLTVLTTLTALSVHAHAGPPALLVLRSACFRQDLPRLHPIPRATLLSHQETCDVGWNERVTRRAVSTLTDGGLVEIIGWPGAAVCESISVTASVLRRPQPASCLRLKAQAAAVAELARRLRWSRALLPRAPPSSDCEAALRELTLFLLETGLLVRRAMLSARAFADRPEVLILCVSVAAKIGSKIESMLKDTDVVILLLHFEELMRDATDFANKDIENFKTMKSESIKASKVNYSSDSTSEREINDHKLNHEMVQNLNSPLSFYNIHRKMQIRSGKSSMNSTELSTNQLIVPFTKPSEGNQTEPANIVHEGTRSLDDRRDARGTTMSTKHAEIESSQTLQISKKDLRYLEIFSHFNDLFPGWLLILSENIFVEEHLTSDSISEKVTKVLESVEESERARQQSVQRRFLLYVRSGDRSAWSRAATLATNLTRALDGDRPWAATVALHDWHALERWNGTKPEDERDHWNGSNILATVLGAGGAVVVAAGGALAARWEAVRRRRRRRREDVVLTPVHFTFPADEARRVGEGMETMLSCWLQQLHEFGGPELERPDLLKRPGVTARVPSAPSSTCSVNRVVVDRRIRYKGDAVHLRHLQVTGTLELKRKSTDVLLLMQNLRQENVNPFIGCLCEGRPALVFDECWRGSLEDVLMADDIKLDWTFRLSLLSDLVKGMRYLHGSPLRAHGRLSSRNCVVDSRWVLRVTDYGLPALHRTQGLPPAQRTPRELLWTAPELIREAREGGGWLATQSGDVFSFAIIMQEVIVRGEPYCMLSFTPEEIIDKLCRPPPLIRPSVSMGAAPPEAVSVMRQCWSEAPDLRPDFNRLHDVFRQMQRGRKINIVDSMFEMLEKYSNNLEELIRERTEQLDMEKKKTEQLLNRMLPRSVAERLMLGSRVEPEEFEEVSIYFSDIVGFTALAARSTAVQVVDLLNDLYTTFDAAIEQYRVYKVETIGDAYMVVGGLPQRTRDHAESVATMALHLLHLAGRFRVRHLPDTPLHLRIGLHTGPCCAGVVGLTMPRYCLFGDTVNTASRMESTGAAWRIQISSTTAEKLLAAGGYKLRSRGLTQIKGKGAMHTYWLLGKEGFDPPLPTPPPLDCEGEVLLEVEGESEPEAAPVDSGLSSASPDNRPAPYLTSSEQSRRPVSSATSADSCSPPPEPRGSRALLPTTSVDHSAPYARYRWLGGNARTLKRQWSLERGDALAAAAASDAPAGSRVTPRHAPRYRTRAEPADDD
ncbi:uncharacterized protein LOC114249220 isoform X1 [Bombyx mandarina]|uniref:Guanylate cyclase n=1 Tax=Bombyx mandarina TaxID=7092 RepID=A0A6J2KC54_BOMMA|nr:uncharacterized protein LOC114249220 isoform X1 [Bombyx mandarina]